MTIITNTLLSPLFLNIFSSLIVLIIVFFWDKSIVPYFESLIYKGIKIDGEWKFHQNDKFTDGTFDIGLIGPAPYIRAKSINPDALKIIVGIKNSEKSPFRSVIISKKGSKFLKYSDLKGKKFAFGSPESTLSYYVPKSMLINSNTIKELKYYDLLGRHDRVAP